MINPDWSVR